MAYPRRNNADRSDIRMAVRLTVTERDALRKAAHREGMTLSEYVRARILTPEVAPRKQSA